MRQINGVNKPDESMKWVGEWKNGWNGWIKWIDEMMRWNELH